VVRPSSSSRQMTSGCVRCATVSFSEGQIDGTRGSSALGHPRSSHLRRRVGAALTWFDRDRPWRRNAFFDPIAARNDGRCAVRDDRAVRRRSELCLVAARGAADQCSERPAADDRSDSTASWKSAALWYAAVPAVHPGTSSPTDHRVVRPRSARGPRRCLRGHRISKAWTGCAASLSTIN
jgi:hypothetical protein